MAKNYYAVKVGFEPGIYRSWREAEKQIKGFPGQDYKGFDTEEEAIKYLYDLDGKYQDLEKLGEGGFAEVYKILDFTQPTVIKLLKTEHKDDQGAVSRFRREYEITKSLSDIDGVVNVYDFSEKELSYRMEYFDSTLLKFVNQNELTDADRFSIIQQILKIMQKVHDRDILHRDLSPSNLFVTDEGIKIADFGLGKNLNSLDSHITKYTRNFGQYNYCSPEQAEQLKDATKRSDIYSIGKIINFIMTKKPNDTNHILKSVVEVATARDPQSRYLDCKTMLENVNIINEYSLTRTEQAHIDLSLRDGTLNVLVENYFHGIDGLELCEKLSNIDYPVFDNLLIEYMLVSENRGIEMIDKISQSFQKFCGFSFAANDRFAYFSYKLIQNDFSQVVKNKAIYILNYVAWGVNRYYAQDLVKDLLKKTLSPQDALTHSKLKDRNWENF